MDVVNSMGLRERSGTRPSKPITASAKNSNVAKLFYSLSCRLVNNILKFAHLCPVNSTLLPTAGVTTSDTVLMNETFFIPIDLSSRILSTFILEKS
jgi:hypothetical protein